MRRRMIERGRSSETESGTKAGEKRGLGFWRHSNLCINITGSHHVPLLPPASAILRPWQYKLYYFFRLSTPRFLSSFTRADQEARLVPVVCHNS